MEFAEIAQWISSLGFPIFACVMLFKFNTNTIAELTKAVQNNTEVMNKVLAKLNENDDD